MWAPVSAVSTSGRRMSITFTLSGYESILTSQYYPPLQLDKSSKYALGLVGFHSFHTVPNIENNVFYYDNGKKIDIPTGSYEIKDIEKFLQTKLGADKISLVPNNNTLKVDLHCTYDVDFTPKDSLHELLGFSQKNLPKEKTHHSDLSVQMMKVLTFRISCNITTGAYLNDELLHTIYEFAPEVSPGFVINEVPKNIIYLPVTVDTINNITLKVLDQNGKPVNFRGEYIQIRLELKKWG